MGVEILGKIDITRTDPEPQVQPGGDREGPPGGGRTRVGHPEDEPSRRIPVVTETGEPYQPPPRRRGGRAIPVRRGR